MKKLRERERESITPHSHQWSSDANKHTPYTHTINTTYVRDGEGARELKKKCKTKKHRSENINMSNAIGQNWEMKIIIKEVNHSYSCWSLKDISNIFFQYDNINNNNNHNNGHRHTHPKATDT